MYDLLTLFAKCWGDAPFEQPLIAHLQVQPQLWVRSLMPSLANQPTAAIGMTSILNLQM
jgi:hypothetical protein